MFTNLRTWRRVLGAGAGAVALTAALVSPAEAFTTTHVGVVDFSFSTPTATISLGAPVEWDYAATNFAPHTSTDNSGFALWDSGPHFAGTTFTYTSTVSGSFAYHCAIHTFMTATLRVKDRITPATGTLATSYSIRWATALPAGTTFDVQVKLPGALVFTPWFTHSSLINHSFHPAITGVYRFRSRPIAATGLIGDWSPTSTLTVS
jgi:plastocyanin